MPEAMEATRVAEAYYDSEDADTFYHEVWGGEDIHIGLYAPGDTIAQASRKTVARMAEALKNLRDGARVLDLGSGYGGAARYLAGTYGAQVTCVNLSSVENERNRALSEAQGLSANIDVIHGAFESVPVDSGAFDVVWSQDAFLHSADRMKVLSEAARALKSGGELIFTDPMQADDIADTSVLKPIYERIHLSDLASVAFYREALTSLGLEEVRIEPHTAQLVTHYGRVRDELNAKRTQLEGRISADYIERMLAGLSHWVNAGGAGHLVWGVLHFRKP